MSCAICKQRKAKRHCPGLHGEICSLCCGSERENTVSCPIDCSYLVEAHRYEWERVKPQPPDKMPYPTYEIHDGFLKFRELFVAHMAMQLLRRAMELPGTQDSDVLEALGGLIRTRETLTSGLVYDSVPQAPVPEALFRGLQEATEEFRKEETKFSRWTPIKDDEITKTLVFLARLAHARSNGRPKCKAYLTFLREQFPQVVAQQTTGGIILPG
jgi:hypothetical protein